METNLTSIIIEHIKDKEYKPVNSEQLYIEICGKDSGEYANFMKALAEVEKNEYATVTGKGKIRYNRESEPIVGIFRAAAKGFGFVVPDVEYAKKIGVDIYIGADEVGTALHGDKVCVHLNKGHGENNGRKSGKITEVVERNTKCIIGTLLHYNDNSKKYKKYCHVEPDDKHYSFMILIPYDSSVSEIADGTKIEVEIVEYPNSDSEHFHTAYGKLIKVFGDSESIEANYNSILYTHKIKTDFDIETLNEAEAKNLTDIKLDGRLDLRDKMIITIDGADAKDLDDAISVDRTENGGYVLGVHIADVSEYVQPNTALDREAFERGTSIYFADKVIPMLPKALSNGICSLNSGVDRYTLSVFITLTPEGEIESCAFNESVISTKVRGVYSELNEVIEIGKDSQFYDKYAILYPETMTVMLELYNVLDANSRKRGALELETVEAKIIIGEDGSVSDIVKFDRGVAERLIEQFMLCANEAVANWLFWQDLPCIYRIHEDPSPEKVQSFSIFANNLGMDITPLRKKSIHPTSFQRMLIQAKEMDLSTVVSYVLLRSLMKAKYSAVPSPHFGLAIEKYCHFTSPIRRYPDLGVHRIIKQIIHGHVDEKTVSDLTMFSEQAALQSSETELNATQSERDIDDLYKAYYMRDKVGEIYEGVISSVMSFGFFVELDNTCEGLVPISTLDGYFEFDERSMSLTCGRKVYVLGKKVSVKIIDVNLITRHIEMKIIENRV